MTVFTTRQAGRGWLGWRGAAYGRIKLSPSGEEHRPWSTQELRPWPWGSPPSNLYQLATACPWFTCVWLIYSDLEQCANYLHEMPLHLHECGLARGQPLSDRGNWFAEDFHKSKFISKVTKKWQIGWFLAPSGALIAIPTYYWPSSSTHPTFSDHTGPQYWTFTFWATTAISKAITGLICWLHVYLMGTTGHHCKIVQDSAR